MTHEDIIKEMDEKAFQKKETEPYQKFGLRCDLRNETPGELAHLMVGFKEYTYTLWDELRKVMTSDSEDNQYIAIVGPQGAGKTSLAEDFCESITSAKQKGQFKITEKVNFAFTFPLRFFDGSESSPIDSMFGKETRNNFVVVFDDSQNIIYPVKDGADTCLQQFQQFNKSLSKFKKSLIIYTWTAFGWDYAINHIPDFPKYFSNIIYLPGLEEKYCKDMITKRFHEFSYDEKVISPTDIFTEIDLQRIFSNSSRNPRLIITILAKAMNKAAELGNAKVTSKEIDEILEEEGINRLKSVEDKEMLNDKIFIALLSYPRVPIQIVRLFTGLDRSTIQKSLEHNYTNLKLLDRKSDKEKPQLYLYSIKEILRAKLEGMIMCRIIEKSRIQII